MIARPAPYVRATAALERADWLIPTLARVIFAGVLMIYFVHSGLTKPGAGIAGLWSPSAGAYVQIFPRTFAAAGYDTEALGPLHRLIAVAATLGELILPALIVLGLATRLAAAGMICFVTVQSLTDVIGHGQHGELGSWFDRFPDAAILDQRALWCFLLAVLVIRGAGPLSLDRVLIRR